jgi:hypothetical protein
MEAITRLRYFAVALVTTALLAGASPAKAATTPAPTLADVKQAVINGDKLTSAETKVLATAASRVTGEDSALITLVLALDPTVAKSLPVSTKVVNGPTVSTTPISYALASTCSGSASRKSTIYYENITGARIWRYGLTKYWSYNKCTHRVNDNDWQGSDEIDSYVYGAFQPVWDFDGTQSHSGRYYTFNNYTYGGHSSKATGKFSYCVSVPFLGNICLQRPQPWVKVNAHYNGSSAIYSDV